MKYITGLANRENKSVGYIPKQAYEGAITGIKTGKRWSNKCGDKLYVCEENLDLVGFTLASFGRHNALVPVARVNQICIQEDARLIERGKALLAAVIAHAETRRVFNFGCGCADDLESNKFWQAMGWEKTGERRGIAFTNTWKQTSDRLVNLYSYQREQNDKQVNRAIQ